MHILHIYIVLHVLVIALRFLSRFCRECPAQENKKLDAEAGGTIGARALFQALHLVCTTGM